MSKTRKRVVYKPKVWNYNQKYWATGRILLLVLVGVASQQYPWMVLAFFGLGAYWTVQLVVGLCRGKYTGVR
jgi:hypothetical protein